MVRVEWLVDEPTQTSTTCDIDQGGDENRDAHHHHRHHHCSYYGLLIGIRNDSVELQEAESDSEEEKEQNEAREVGRIVVLGVAWTPPIPMETPNVSSQPANAQAKEGEQEQEEVNDEEFVEWMAEHARNVVGLLSGGLSVVGICRSRSKGDDDDDDDDDGNNKVFMWNIVQGIREDLLAEEMHSDMVVAELLHGDEEKREGENEGESRKDEILVGNQSSGGNDLGKTDLSIAIATNERIESCTSDGSNITTVNHTVCFVNSLHSRRNSIIMKVEASINVRLLLCWNEEEVGNVASTIGTNAKAHRDKTEDGTDDRFQLEKSAISQRIRDQLGQVIMHSRAIQDEVFVLQPPEHHRVMLPHAPIQQSLPSKDNGTSTAQICKIKFLKPEPSPFHCPLFLLNDIVDTSSERALNSEQNKRHYDSKSKSKSKNSNSNISTALLQGDVPCVAYVLQNASAHEVKVGLLEDLVRSLSQRLEVEEEQEVKGEGEGERNPRDHSSANYFGNGYESRSTPKNENCVKLGTGLVLQLRNRFTIPFATLHPNLDPNPDPASASISTTDNLKSLEITTNEYMVSHASYNMMGSKDAQAESEALRGEIIDRFGELFGSVSQKKAGRLKKRIYEMESGTRKSNGFFGGRKLRLCKPRIISSPQQWNDHATTTHVGSNAVNRRSNYTSDDINNNSTSRRVRGDASRGTDVYSTSASTNGKGFFLYKAFSRRARTAIILCFMVLLLAFAGGAFFVSKCGWSFSCDAIVDRVATSEVQSDVENEL